MSNIIPPMISSSPPPIDVQDDDDDDGFGDFRVADLALNLSGFNLGRCSPEALTKLPSPIESKEPIPSSPLCTPTRLSNGVCIEKIDAENENSDIQIEVLDSTEVNSLHLANGCPNSDSDAIDLGSSTTVPHNVHNHEEIPAYEEPKPPDGTNDLDFTEVEELERIPFPPVFSPSISPLPEREVRTSPEGADSRMECLDSNQFETGNDGEEYDPATFDESVKDNLSDSVTCENDESNKKERASSIDEVDDFADFADFTSQPFSVQVNPLYPEEPVPSNIIVSSDCIDDFDDFESAAPPELTTSVTPSTDVGSRVSALFPDLQNEPCEDSYLTSCLNACLDDSSSVWGSLKDLETSNALTLQWTSSTSSKKLLSSLNIDSRNVLLGPRWNTSVPRFAANLGCEPLEPKQAETSTAASAPAINRVPPIVDDVVPAAQFDWNSSGLTNPLDCLGKDEAAVVGGPSTCRSIVDSLSSAEYPPTIPQQSVEPSPADYVWSNPSLPDTDILLPRPAEITLESSVFRALNLGEDSSPLNDEPVDKLKLVLEEPSSNAWEQQNEEVEIPATWTISNPVNSNVVSRPQLSPEAYRVVETIPDLSFLSARNLLLAANQSMSRFKTGSRL